MPPANPGAWLDQNLSSEGSLFARGADLTLYGTKKERTLQIFAPALVRNELHPAGAISEQGAKRIAPAISRFCVTGASWGTLLTGEPCPLAAR